MVGHNSLKLKKDEIKQILETVNSEVIVGQLESLEAQVEDSKANNDDSGSEEGDPEMKTFLQGIDLMDDEE